MYQVSGICVKFDYFKIPITCNKCLSFDAIPNMQEPIISEELFDRVQELRSHKRRNTKPGRASLFAGLLFCPDCGAKLHFCAAKSLNHNQEFYRCANYNSGRGTCNTHYIRNVVLEQIVAEAVGSPANFVQCYEPIFLYLLAKNNNVLHSSPRCRN